MAPTSNSGSIRCRKLTIQTISELLAACDDIGVFSSGSRWPFFWCMGPLFTAYKLIKRIRTEVGRAVVFLVRCGNLHFDCWRQDFHRYAVKASDIIETLDLARLRNCTLAILTDLGRVALLLLIRIQLARSNIDQLSLCCC